MDGTTLNFKAPEKTKDPKGEQHQKEFSEFEEHLKNTPHDIIVSDGYFYAVQDMVDLSFHIMEGYNGTDGRSYDVWRPANDFESHVLAKIKAINMFFNE